MTFRHLGIVGLGLLGGSLAMDARRLFPDMAVTGVARRRDTLDEAARLQVDGATVFTHLATGLDALRDADLVVLCTPVQTIIAQLAALAPLLAPGTVVTDVGSTKRAILNAASTALPPSVFFVGGHPMAGSDRAGLSYAREGLYRGATWGFCIPAGAEAAAARVQAFVTALGARPLVIDPDEHDAIVALSSHLPHVTASALTNVTLGSAQADALIPFIAGGFRDATRVAAASPAMWRDICLTNRDRLSVAILQLIDELATWREAIRAGDAAHLEALLTTASHRRERLNQ
jgi:prephenate dehydrogenase